MALDKAAEMPVAAPVESTALGMERTIWVGLVRSVTAAMAVKLL
jgi:hypothetical protein